MEIPTTVVSEESEKSKSITPHVQKATQISREYFSPSAWEFMKKFAETAIISKAIPSGLDNAAKIMMVLQAGYEKGKKPVESLQCFYIVNGKITQYGSSVIGDLKRAGYKIKWNKATEEIVEVTLSKDGDSHTESYTKDEAMKAKLWGKFGVWTSHPKDMMRWKAVGRAIRFFCPEVLEGIYIKEEADDFVEASIVSQNENSQSLVNEILSQITVSDLEGLTRIKENLPEIIRNFSVVERKEVAKFIEDREGLIRAAEETNSPKIETTKKTKSKKSTEGLVSEKSNENIAPKDINSQLVRDTLAAGTSVLYASDENIVPEEIDPFQNSQK